MASVKAMVLDSPGGPLRLAELPDPEPAPGPGAAPRPGLRCLPHRPPHPRRRALASRSCRSCSGTRSSEPTSIPASGSAFRGSAGRTATAASARRGRENLCERARFTGYDLDGGYAELAVADRRFCFPIPEGYPDLQAAPLLCAGLIGYRALRLHG